MDGFELLDEEGGGPAWVRRDHVTAVRVISYRSGDGGPERHLVSALAGGRWWTDATDHATRDLAEARAAAIAGVGGGRSVLTRVRDAWTTLLRRG